MCCNFLHAHSYCQTSMPYTWWVEAKTIFCTQFVECCKETLFISYFLFLKMMLNKVQPAAHSSPTDASVL